MGWKCLVPRPCHHPRRCRYTQEPTQRWAAQTAPFLSGEIGPVEAFKCCRCGEKGASRGHFHASGSSQGREALHKRKDSQSNSRTKSGCRKPCSHLSFALTSHHLRDTMSISIQVQQGEMPGREEHHCAFQEGAFPISHPALKPFHACFTCTWTAFGSTYQGALKHIPRTRQSIQKWCHMQQHQFQEHFSTSMEAFFHSSHLFLAFHTIHLHGSSADAHSIIPTESSSPLICTQMSSFLLLRWPPLGREADGSNTH